MAEDGEETQMTGADEFRRMADGDPKMQVPRLQTATASGGGDGSAGGSGGVKSAEILRAKAFGHRHGKLQSYSRGCNVSGRSR